MHVLALLKATILSILVGPLLSPRSLAYDPENHTLVYRWEKPFLTFEYFTSKTHDKNWIGLYKASGGGPDNRKYVQDSLVWVYAPNQEGTVQISTSTIPPGNYKAYFLAKGGYKWLTSPISVILTNGGGSLSLEESNSPFMFKYSTISPHQKNWIAIYYACGGGPDDQEFVADPLVWDWAPEGQGTIRLSASHLQPGSYKAYFLQDNGFKWIANPVTLFVPGTGPLQFVVPKFRTANARLGQFFKASIDGLLANPRDTNTVFMKSGSTDNWVRVSASGILSGTPSGFSSTTRLTIEAIASDGSRTKMEVSIPVVPRSFPLVRNLSVLSLNLWHGGTQVHDYHNKQVRFLSNSGADLVGLQESNKGHAIRLAKALGWYFWQGESIGIISRYPIVEVYPTTSKGGAVRIALDYNKHIILWNAHLSAYPYGPYEFCFNNTDKEIVLTHEKEAGRTGQIKEIMDRMKDALQYANTIPVILTGDFNAPSHLDWTESTKHLHCEFGPGRVTWPTSMYPTRAGLVDTYRVVHRDPIAQAGNTWSPVYLDNGGRREPMDRIDFIYHKGLRVLESDTVMVGDAQPEPNHQDNEWTSDHAAVKTVFRV